MKLRLLKGLHPRDLGVELSRVGLEPTPDLPLEQWARCCGVKVRSVTEAAFEQFSGAFGEQVAFRHWQSDSGDGLVIWKTPFFEDLLRDYPAQGELARELRERIANLVRRDWHYKTPRQDWTITSPQIMGILNVTPDSFSDGGLYENTAAALARAEEMLEAGATIIDIGGESTRPGAPPVSEGEELKRILPVVKALANVPGCLISVDTTKAPVARAALENGADLINDISGLGFDPALAETVGAFKAPLVIMHIQGTPQSMQAAPSYHQVTAEVLGFLETRIETARKAGVEQILVDPGIGFGKSLEHNLELMRRLGELRQFGFPVLLGTSRKSFLGKILEATVEKRLIGSVASQLSGLLNGASVFRVHDVRETREAFAVFRAVEMEKSVKFS